MIQKSVRIGRVEMLVLPSTRIFYPPSLFFLFYYYFFFSTPMNMNKLYFLTDTGRHDDEGG
jgi:hypothetical protein